MTIILNHSTVAGAVPGWRRAQPVHFHNRLPLGRTTDTAFHQTLERRDESASERPRSTRRDVVVAVGRRVILLVEHVLHVQLPFNAWRKLAVESGIDAGEAIQQNRVIR